MAQELLHVEWSAKGARREVMRALRGGEAVEFICRGWKAKLLRSFLPKWLDSHAKLTLCDFFKQVALMRLVAVCTYGEAIGRPIEMYNEGDAFTVLFRRRPPQRSSGTSPQ